MMFQSRTAAGIDICENSVSIAVLKNGRDGFRLVKAAAAPVPAGVIKDGNIESPALFSKMLRELKRSNGIGARRAAVSLFAAPAVVQIIDMPEQVPSNIRQYVRNEVKQYIALPSRNIALDFCRVGSRGRGDLRILAATTDNKRMIELAGVCSHAGLDVEVIEPALLSYVRAFHDKKIAGKSDSNVLLCILAGTVLTLCVLRKEAIDFVRTKVLAKQVKDNQDLYAQLAEQIGQIIRFYDVEVPDNRGIWDVTVVVDPVEPVKDARETLSGLVACDRLDVRTAEDAWLDTPVNAAAETVAAGAPSPVAIGLAMGLLQKTTKASRINLLAKKTAELRTLKTHALVAANIAAAMWLIMFLAGGGLSKMTDKVDSRISRIKISAQPGTETESLLKERRQIKKQIEKLSAVPGRMKKIYDSHSDVDWTVVLNEISRAIPRYAKLSRLSGTSKAKILLAGQAATYRAAELFVNNLDKSKHISSASLVKTENTGDRPGPIRYEISCSPARRKADIAGAD